MELIRPGTRNGIPHPTCRPAVLRGIVARQNRKLLDGVHPQIATQHAARRAVGGVVDAYPIKPVVILLGPSTGHGNLSSKTSVAAVGPYGEGWLGLDGADTRLERCQICPAPPIERQLSYCRGIHNRA